MKAKNSLGSLSNKAIRWLLGSLFCLLPVLALHAQSINISFVGPSMAHVAYDTGPADYPDEYQTLELHFQTLPAGSGGWVTLAGGGRNRVAGTTVLENLAEGTHGFRILRKYIRSHPNAEPEYQAITSSDCEVDEISAGGTLLFDVELGDFEIHPSKSIVVADGLTLTVTGEGIGHNFNHGISVYGQLVVAGGTLDPGSIAVSLHQGHSFSNLNGGHFRLYGDGIYEFLQCDSIVVVRQNGSLILDGVVSSSITGSNMGGGAVSISKSDLDVSGFAPNEGVIEVTSSTLNGLTVGGDTVLHLDDTKVIGLNLFGQASAHIENCNLSYDNEARDASEIHVKSSIIHRLGIKGTAELRVKESNLTYLDLVNEAGYEIVNCYIHNLRIWNGSTALRSVKKCLLGGVSQVAGGAPVFENCEFNSEVELVNRNWAVFRNNVFLDRIKFSIDSAKSYSQYPTWNEASSVSPVIASNSFIGPDALESGGLAIPIPIGANYYGDKDGYRRVFNHPYERNNFLGRLGPGSMGAVVYGSFDIAPPLQVPPFSIVRNHDQAPPRIWLSGYVYGQSVVPHDPSTQRVPLLKGKPTFVSVQLTVSDEVKGAKVYVEWNGSIVESMNVHPTLRRDISNLKHAHMQRGKVTYDFSLPAVDVSTQELSIFVDFSKVRGLTDVDPFIIHSETLNFVDPPQRPLRIRVIPTQVRGIVFSWGTASPVGVVDALKKMLPAMTPITDDKIEVEVNPVMNFWEPVTNITAFPLFAKMAAYAGTGRYIESKRVDEAPDFVVFVLPQALCTSYFPKTWFDRQSFEGLMYGWSSRILFVAEQNPVAVLHELGHGVGLYLDREQYDRHPPSGLQIDGATVFVEESQELHHFPGSGYSWYETGRNPYDIMGNVTNPSSIPVWTLPSTALAFHNWYQGNLTLTPPTGAYPDRQADRSQDLKRLVIASATDSTGALIQKETRIACGSMETTNSFEPEKDLQFNNQRLIAYNAEGERIHVEDFRARASNRVWKGTFDVPAETARIVVKKVNKRNIWHSGLLQFYPVWEEGPTNLQYETIGLNQLDIQEPLSGSTVGSEMTCVWSIDSDMPPGPEQMKHMLYFRRAGESEWKHFTSAIGESSLTLSTELLPTCNDLELKIVSNDGMDWVENTVSGITVSARNAMVTVTSPSNGQRGAAYRKVFNASWPDAGMITMPVVELARGEDGESSRIFEATVAVAGLEGFTVVFPWGETLHSVDSLPTPWEGEPTVARTGNVRWEVALDANGVPQLKLSRNELSVAEWERLIEDPVAVTVQRGGVAPIQFERVLGVVEFPETSPEILVDEGASGEREHGDWIRWTPLEGSISNFRSIVREKKELGRTHVATYQSNVDGFPLRAYPAGEVYEISVLSMLAEAEVDREFQVAVAAFRGSDTVEVRMREAPLEWVLEGRIHTYGATGQAVGTWTSSIDGILGTGNRLRVPLSVGSHQLRFEYRNPEGATESASVGVEVVEAFDALRMDLEEASLSLHHEEADPTGIIPVWLLPDQSNQLMLQLPPVAADGVVEVVAHAISPGGQTQELGRQQVELQPFESAAVAFDFTPTVPGTYQFRVEIEGILPGPLAEPAAPRVWEFRTEPVYALATMVAEAQPAGSGTTAGDKVAVIGSEVEWSAFPVKGAQFLRWESDGSVVSTEANYRFEVTGNRMLTAVFAVPEFTVTATAEPVSSGWVDGAGPAQLGRSVVLQAHSYGDPFLHWKSGDTVISTDPVLSVAVDGDITVRAVFEVPQYTIGVSTPNADLGTVQGNGVYYRGETARLTAIAAAGYAFSGWYDGNTLVSQSSDYSFAVNESKDFEARFEAAVQFSGGEGTENNPYLLAHANQLKGMQQFPNAFFALVADLDIGVSPWNIGSGWTPVGSSDAPFTGGFDGRGHRITGLTINQSGSGIFGVGLIAYADGASIRNVVLDEVSITVENAANVGALVGAMQGGSIQNVRVEGLLSGGSQMGGIVGYGSQVLVANVVSNAQVEGVAGELGGVFGNLSDSTVQFASASGDVSCREGAIGFVGGLGGHFSGQMEDSYATGSVTILNGSGSAGGLIGGTAWSPFFIVRCYAVGAVESPTLAGGLIGYWGSKWDPNWGETPPDYEGGEVNASFWDTERSGRNWSDGGEGRMTQQLKFPLSASTFAGWDFSLVWSVDPGGSINMGYPYLAGNSQWELKSGNGFSDFNNDGKPDILLQGSNLTVTGQAMDGSGNRLGGAVEVLAGSQRVQLLGIIDMNGDGIGDLILRRLDGTNTYEVRLRNESGAVTATRTYNPGGEDWRLVGVFDQNRDGHTDLIWQNIGTGQVVMWHLDAAGNRMSNRVLVQSMADYRIVGVGDMNGDGFMDILWQRVLGNNTELVAWYLDAEGQRLATNGSRVIGTAAGGYRCVGLADYNSDGILDILWQQVDTQQIVVWHMNAAGVRTSSRVLNVGGPGQLVAHWQWDLRIPAASSDIDGDGHADLLLQRSGDLGVMGQLMNGQGGRLGNATELLGGGSQAQVVGMAGMGGNPHGDLLVRRLDGSNTYEVRIRNESGAVTATRTYNPGGADWRLVGAYDQNQDGTRT
jgi:hypothetical protein